MRKRSKKMNGNQKPQTQKNKIPIWLIVALLFALLMLCVCLFMGGIWALNRSDFDLKDLFSQNANPVNISQNGQEEEHTATYTFAPVDFVTRTPVSGENAIITLTPAPDIELTPIRVAVGYRAPDFSIENIEGESITLSQYQGNYVVFDYWATWCPPCREEMPFIQNIHEEYQQQGLIVLGINGIEGDDLGSVEDFIEDEALTFTILLDNDNVVMNAYNIQFLPTSIFIDPNGIIRDIVIGGISEEEFRNKVDYLISGLY